MNIVSAIKKARSKQEPNDGGMCLIYKGEDKGERDVLWLPKEGSLSAPLTDEAGGEVIVTLDVLLADNYVVPPSAKRFN